MTTFQGLEPSPCQKDWRTIFGDQSGTAVFRRKFHRPTNLDPHEQVWIVFTELSGKGSAQLNDSPLGEFDAAGQLIQFEVTNLLSPFNVLTVEIAFQPINHPTASGGLSGAVVIEIQSE